MAIRLTACSLLGARVLRPMVHAILGVRAPPGRRAPRIPTVAWTYDRTAERIEVKRRLTSRRAGSCQIAGRAGFGPHGAAAPAWPITTPLGRTAVGTRQKIDDATSSRAGPTVDALRALLRRRAARGIPARRTG